MPTPLGAAPAHQVLLVEDDVALGAALRFVLQTAGYRVRLLDTAEALLDRGPLEDLACLVFDEHLPGVAGMDALEALRQRGVTLPAILITTLPRLALQARAREADVTIMEKPILGDRLAAKIRTLIPD